MFDGSGGAPQLDERALEAAVIAWANGPRLGWWPRMKAAVAAYLAASPGGGELDLTDGEALAAFASSPSPPDREQEQLKEALRAMCQFTGEASRTRPLLMEARRRAIELCGYVDGFDNWKRHHADEAEKAMESPMVQNVLTEFARNMGFKRDGLPEYGLSKIVSYVAQVARAQALGFDPELLRLSDEEAVEAAKPVWAIEAGDDGS